jgi:hypothetical protein
MDAFGDLGPVIGPFDWVHTTYASDVKMGVDLDSKADLRISRSGMVKYAGVWYGDWSVFDEKIANGPYIRHRIEALDLKKCNR